jgi:hypothetical protein
MRTKFFDASGRQVDPSIACDTNGVIRHGFTMRTNMLMMDSESRDQFVPLTDEQRSADIDARNAILSDAWRNPTPVLPLTRDANPQTPRTADGSIDMDAVYAQHDRRLQDAWRA